jgi:CrcB protein
MLIYFIVGSSLGAVARFAVERFSTRHAGEGFPLGTLFANLAGSFVLGFAVNSNLEMNVSYSIVAFCGSFTTFGGFIGQTHSRWRHHQTRLISLMYLIITVVGSIAAAVAGIELANSQF